MRARTYIFLLLGLLIVGSIPVIFYTVHFGPSQKFSSAAAWGAFGSYIGGTLGPIFACFAFIALVINLQTQRETLDVSKETAARQWDYLQRKEKRDEWRDAIRDADHLLEEHLKILVSGLGGQITDRRRLLQQVASEVLPSGKCYDPAYADTIFAKYTSEANVASFHGTVALVSDIWELLDGFAENLTEQDSRLLSFYVSYFQGVTSRLHIIGAISDHYWRTRLGKIIGRLMTKGAQFNPERDIGDKDQT